MMLCSGPNAKRQSMNTAMANVMRVQTIRPRADGQHVVLSPLLAGTDALSLDDEEEDEADDEGVEGQRLDDADADEHVGADVARHLGLAGDALEGVAR